MRALESRLHFLILVHLLALLLSWRISLPLGVLFERCIFARPASERRFECRIMIHDVSFGRWRLLLRRTRRVLHIRLLVREEVSFLPGGLTERHILNQAVMLFELLLPNFLANVIVVGYVSWERVECRLLVGLAADLALLAGPSEHIRQRGHDVAAIRIAETLHIRLRLGLLHPRNRVLLRHLPLLVTVRLEWVFVFGPRRILLENSFGGALERIANRVVGRLAEKTIVGRFALNFLVRVEVTRTRQRFSVFISLWDFLDSVVVVTDCDWRRGIEQTEAVAVGH